ncbi:cupin domain-containing protein [Lentzea sp. HUAS12]|uniref:cupin domain-containing protein n=1 Tax=Lentzea sp. HUAS12 TaxID=2951806 RepID=UPI00209FE80C|nr:cupin domain-containing protein [Lentzea sp. HUAS12]USX56357.1 cupin domain-containing protein [Lentzea sp. HUAS12]
MHPLVERFAALARLSQVQEQPSPAHLPGLGKCAPFTAVTAAEVEGVIGRHGLRSEQVVVTRHGVVVPAAQYTATARIDRVPLPGVVRHAALFDLVESGHTLALPGCELWLPGIAVLCDQLRSALAQPVLAGLFLTPASETGLSVHTDAYDVLAVQTTGSKRWRVFAKRPEPVRNAPVDVSDEPVLDVVLQQGDALFVPRGCPHVASAESFSLHVSLGVQAMTAREVLVAAMRSATLSADLDAPMPYREVGDLNDRRAAVLRRASEALLTGLSSDQADRVYQALSSSTTTAPSPGRLRRLESAAEMTDSPSWPGTAP